MNDESTGSGSKWEPTPEDTDDPTTIDTESPAATGGEEPTTARSRLTGRLGRRGTLGVAGAGLILVSGLGGYAIASTTDGGSDERGTSRHDSDDRDGMGRDKGERRGHHDRPPPGGSRHGDGPRGQDGGPEQDSDQQPSGQDTDES